ncbi:MAG: hypothetical protein MJ107_04465 [Lachnospiraceae bacterium]|nr:hypothetical protein [Lachnospiraceae bacterium]
MEALKKTGVAAMIMVVCIALSIIIGEVRKPAFVNPTPSTSTESTIHNWIYDISTFGKISNQINEGITDISVTSTSTEVNDVSTDVSVGKIIGIIILIAFVLSLFKKR